MKVVHSAGIEPRPQPRAATRYGIAASLLPIIAFAVSLDAQSTTTRPVPVTVVVMPADTDEATATFRLTDTDALLAEEITLGPLVSAARPDFQVVPDRRKVELTEAANATKVENAGAARDWTVSIVVGHLIPFGESTVPVLVRGETRQTLRFQKPGLIARAPSGTGLEVTEGGPLSVVLENPTAFQYSNVRARWRFHQTEVCSAVVIAPPKEGASDNAIPIANSRRLGWRLTSAGMRR